MKVSIYTDGAARGNPDGPGGYGVVLEHVDPKGELHVKELSGGYVRTTNNRMELSAVIAALSALKEPCRVLLTTDSQYVVNGMEKGWAKKWQANGWRKSDKSPALNTDLWQRLLELCEIHTVSFHWVKGHAGHPENERCDKLAVDYYTTHFPR